MSSLTMNLPRLSGKNVVIAKELEEISGLLQNKSEDLKLQELSLQRKRQEFEVSQNDFLYVLRAEAQNICEDSVTSIVSCGEEVESRLNDLMNRIKQAVFKFNRLHDAKAAQYKQMQDQIKTLQEELEQANVRAKTAEDSSKSARRLIASLKEERDLLRRERSTMKAADQVVRTSQEFARAFQTNVMTHSLSSSYEHPRSVSTINKKRKASRKPSMSQAQQNSISNDVTQKGVSVRVEKSGIRVQTVLPSGRGRLCISSNDNSPIDYHRTKIENNSSTTEKKNNSFPTNSEARGRLLSRLPTQQLTPVAPLRPHAGDNHKNRHQWEVQHSESHEKDKLQDARDARRSFEPSPLPLHWKHRQEQYQEQYQKLKQGQDQDRQSYHFEPQARDAKNIHSVSPYREVLPFQEKHQKTNQQHSPCHLQFSEVTKNKTSQIKIRNMSASPSVSSSPNSPVSYYSNSRLFTSNDDLVMNTTGKMTASLAANEPMPSGPPPRSKSPLVANAKSVNTQHTKFDARQSSQVHHHLNNHGDRNNSSPQATLPTMNDNIDDTASNFLHFTSIDKSPPSLRPCSSSLLHFSSTNNNNINKEKDYTNSILYGSSSPERLVSSLNHSAATTTNPQHQNVNPSVPSAPVPSLQTSIDRPYTNSILDTPSSKIFMQHVQPNSAVSAPLRPVSSRAVSVAVGALSLGALSGSRTNLHNNIENIHDATANRISNISPSPSVSFIDRLKKAAALRWSSEDENEGEESLTKSLKMKVSSNLSDERGKIIRPTSPYLSKLLNIDNNNSDSDIKREMKVSTKNDADGVNSLSLLRSNSLMALGGLRSNSSHSLFQQNDTEKNITPNNAKNNTSGSTSLSNGLKFMAGGITKSPSATKDRFGWIKSILAETPKME